VQITKAFGAHVTGVCSTTKVEMVRSIGADHVIDYTQVDFAEVEQLYDLILDIGGNSSLSRLRHALTPRGNLVITGGEGGGRWLGGTDRQLRALMLSPFVGQKLGTFVSKENHEDMIVLKELIESGTMGVTVDDLSDDAALVMIDVQRGFDDPAFGLRNNTLAEMNCAKLLEGWRRTGRHGRRCRITATA
jgi:NADPH:quinone reductase-like Zn-dependent oxidoreductase